MDCRVSLLVASGLMAFGAGCVTSPVPVSSADPPPNVVVQKAAEGPKRPPMPGTVVSLARMKERAADESNDPAQQMKAYDEARQLYQNALKIDANCREAIQGLARVYARMEDYPHALEVYQKALDKNPKDHGMWFDFGSCYNRKKDFTRSVPCFEKALQLDPENRQYMTTLGFTLAYSGQTERGLAMLTRSMGAALAHYNLARLFDRQRQYELSRQHLQMALQINPNLEQAREMLAATNGLRGSLQFKME